MSDPMPAAGGPSGARRDRPRRDVRRRAASILEALLARLSPPPPPPPVVQPSHPAGHFYSPVPSLEDIQAGEANFRKVRPLAGIDLDDAGQLALLDELVPYYRELPWGETPGNGLRYGYQNGMYSYADAIFLYCVMRRFRPRRIIEVGSGHSSCVMLDTAERFLGGAVDFTFVEPYPDAFLALLKPEDRATARLVGTRVQDVPLATFEALQSDDILFIDSSHVSKFGSDLNHLVFEVLPRLAPGVLVHFHDVFFPFEYPREVLYSGMAWNEAYLLRAFLQFNQAFRVRLFTTYLETVHSARVFEAMPLCRRNPGGALWLQRR